MLGDKGSGYDIGLRALQAVIDGYDQDSVWPDLGRRLLRALLLNEPNDLIDRAQAATRRTSPAWQRRCLPPGATRTKSPLKSLLGRPGAWRGTRPAARESDQVRDPRPVRPDGEHSVEAAAFARRWAASCASSGRKRGSHRSSARVCREPSSSQDGL